MSTRSTHKRKTVPQRDVQRSVSKVIVPHELGKSPSGITWQATPMTADGGICLLHIASSARYKSPGEALKKARNGGSLGKEDLHFLFNSWCSISEPKEQPKPEWQVFGFDENSKLVPVDHSAGGGDEENHGIIWAPNAVSDPTTDHAGEPSSNLHQGETTSASDEIAAPAVPSHASAQQSAGPSECPVALNLENKSKANPMSTPVAKKVSAKTTGPSAKKVPHFASPTASQLAKQKSLARPSSVSSASKPRIAGGRKALRDGHF